MFRTRPILLYRRERRIGVHMAGARAVSKLTGRVFDVRIFRLLVRSRLVVTCMTAGTIGLERRELPLYDLGVALMALSALQVVAVVLRLIRQTGVAVICWCPRVRAVAQTAVLGGIEVSRILTGCLCAVVAGRAGSENLVVVHRGHRFPDVCAVAILADVCRLDMRWAFTGGIGTVVTTEAIVDDVGMVEVSRCPSDCCMTVVAIVATGYMRWVFAGCRNAVMARATRTDDLRVINGKDGYPDVRRVAVFADIARLYMRRGFARRIRAVMAAGAITRDVDVVEVRGQPADRRVTIVTVVATVDMTLVLAGRDDAVVAGAAGADHLSVVGRVHRHPDVGRMTIFADIAGLDVRLILARRLGTVVAAEAIARDVDVIEVRGQPAGCRMTIIAVVATSDVRGVLARGRQAVVTGAAATDDLRVVNHVCRRPDVAVVAIFANVGGLYMRWGLAGGLDPIVAAETVPNDAGMVEIRRSPRVRRVAVITSIATVDMRRVFARGRDAVVAGAAGANNLRVVDGEYGREHVGIVAILADIARLYVGRILAGRFNAIVAIDAASGDVDMIEVRR